MQRTQHHTNNTVIGAPIDWSANTELPCSALAVTACSEGETGVPVMKSYWRPTRDELDLLSHGALVELSVAGTKHPPVRICVEGSKHGF